MTDDNTRKWAIPTDLNNAEERIFATQAHINYRTWLVDLSAIDTIDDEQQQTRVFVDKVMDPYVMPALILIAAKRENPTTTIRQVVEHIDAGEWELDFESLGDDEDTQEVDGVPAPLDPPPPPTPNAN